jgi:hypothetical protein
VDPCLWVILSPHHTSWKQVLWSTGEGLGRLIGGKWSTHSQDSLLVTPACPPSSPGAFGSHAQFQREQPMTVHPRWPQPFPVGVQRKPLNSA